MTITRNAVRCNHCGVEIESRHRHDFVGHSCDKAPKSEWRPKRKWVDGPDGRQVLIELNELEPPTFYVDGGHEYLRRAGDLDHYTDISIYDDHER